MDNTNIPPNTFFQQFLLNEKHFKFDFVEGKGFIQHHKQMRNQIDFTPNTNQQQGVYLLKDSEDNDYQHENQIYPHLLDPYIKTQTNHQLNAISKFIIYQDDKAFFKVKFQNINYYVNIQVHTILPWRYPSLLQYDMLDQLLPILKRSIILGNYDIEVIGNMLRVVWHIYYENLYDTRMERFYIDLKRSRS